MFGSVRIWHSDEEPGETMSLIRAERQASHGQPLTKIQPFSHVAANAGRAGAERMLHPYITPASTTPCHITPNL